jgi:phosphatidylglycerophosphatase C
MSQNLALFDFDGTLTTKDTLFNFIHYAVGSLKFYSGLIYLTPTLIAFKLKLIPNYKAKEIMLSHYFKGWEQERFEKIAQTYATMHINKLIRPKALQKLHWHKTQGDQVVIVSASIGCWLKPWCDLHHIPLLSTQLSFKGGVFSGKLLTPNCHGKEKVNRIQATYPLDNYKTIYAYGDSSGDKEMLALAHKAYYKPFRD